jgi:hypothetical protein
MTSRSLVLRLGSPLAVLLLLGAAAIACKSKGNGIGTAPIGIPCPDTRPVAASPCPDAEHVGVEANVCAYEGTCADPTARGSAFFFCPGGTNAAWKCIDATDAGPVDASTDGADGETSGDANGDGDAEVGETDPDATSADVTDADGATTDTGDAAIDETATDDADATGSDTLGD